MSKSRPAVMNMSSYFISTSSSAASSPVASKSPGMPIACRMSVEPSTFDAASTSQVRRKDAYLGGLMEEQRRDPSHQEEDNSEDSDNPAAGTWYCKGEPVAQNNKSWKNTLAHGASSSVDKDSQKNTEATWDHHPHGQEDLWTRCFLGESVQIENTRVSSTQNRIRIARHGDSSEDIVSQLSKIANHGEEEYRSETSFTEL